MTKIFKQLGRHWAACLAVVALLIVQAYCDLSLPDYTSKIVDTGIQQGGIESPVPDTVRVGVGVGFVRQCGVVLGHEQLERLQRCAADGVGHGAFNAALLDAGVHNFACVIGQA